jgi:DtxR family Mn-dependent transcriptional regulator
VASPVTEEYLETIYNMTMEGDAVIGARLADKFRVSRPTVTETIHRLVAEGYATQNEDKSIVLTPSGTELTEQVLRRHRLAERLLFDVIGLDPIEAHEQAHTLEHGMSDDLARRISERLGNPLTCPHGNPIPGNASSGLAFLKEQNAYRLSQVLPGTTVRVVLISEVVEDESEVLRQLAATGIHPGARLTVTDRTESGDLAFEAGDRQRSIALDLASKIWVADPPAETATAQE